MIRFILASVVSFFVSGALAQAPGQGGMVPNSVSSYPNLTYGAGLAIGQGSIAIANAGTGYAAGDLVTLQCPGVTFTTSPAITVTHVTGGVIDGSTLTNTGVTTSVANRTCTFTQASTSGAGTGATWTATFAPITSNLSFAGLDTGGAGQNGNTFLGAETPSASGIGGGEHTFIGDRAGSGFTGTATANTAVGHNACGNGGATPPTGNFNSCFGNDAGRNIFGTAANNTLVGQGAGQNVRSNSNTIVGNASGGTAMTGGTHTIIGQGSGTGLTSATNNLLFGPSVGNNLTNGGFNIILGTNGMPALAAGTNFYFAVGVNSTPSLSITGMDTASSSIGKFAGALQVNGTGDAASSTGGALQVVGGASVAKRFWIPAITTSAGLQTAVLCQSSGGEMIADSVACLASGSQFKNIRGSMEDGALDKLIRLPIDRWEYKAEGNFTSADWTRERIGPIAQDVAAMDPRLAGYDKEGNVRTFSPDQLLAFTIKAVQEHAKQTTAEYAQLKAENDNLRACNDNWKCRLFGIGK